MPVKKDAQLNTPIPLDLKDAWDAEALRQKQRGVRLQGRRIYPGNLLNGLVAWYLALSPTQRDEIADASVDCLAKWIDGDVGSNGPSGLAKIPSTRLRGKGAVERPRPSKSDSYDNGPGAVLSRK